MKMEDAAQRKKARRGVGTGQQAFPAGSLEPGVGGEGGGGVGSSWPNNSGSDEVCALSSILTISRSGVSLTLFWELFPTSNRAERFPPGVVRSQSLGFLSGAQGVAI